VTHVCTRTRPLALWPLWRTVRMTPARRTRRRARAAAHAPPRTRRTLPTGRSPHAPLARATLIASHPPLASSELRTGRAAIGWPAGATSSPRPRHCGVAARSVVEAGRWLLNWWRGRTPRAQRPLVSAARTWPSSCVWSPWPLACTRRRARRARRGGRSAARRTRTWCRTGTHERRAAAHTR
jgi:hypothetical protein